MRLCMFHPLEQPMERGWPGRLDGEHVIQLAAQTLQAFFTGGGTAREHAVYPLAGVRLLAPVLHPPSVRVFDRQQGFAFANPAAIRSPGAARPSDAVSQGSLVVLPRLAAVIGADGEIGGYTILAEWRDPRREPPKDRDFALALGPVVVTPDELDSADVAAVVRRSGAEALRGRFHEFDWAAACELAAEGTTLHPGDLLAGPALGAVELPRSAALEIEVAGIGVLAATAGG